MMIAQIPLNQDVTHPISTYFSFPNSTLFGAIDKADSHFADTFGFENRGPYS